MENIGARRLHTIMTRLLDEILFDVPDVEHGEVVLDAEDVRERLRDVVQDTDLRKYIL
jgi:ATP-dependent HslUV protease ATP-binding subunit HslU